MKKHFSHTKRPVPAKGRYAGYDERDYDKNEYDWDSVEEETVGGGKVEGEYGSGTYYSSDEAAEGIGYGESDEYADEGAENEE